MGREKKVLLFLADPDLPELMLPPQLKGNLNVHTAKDLIKAIKETTKHYTTGDFQFFENSSDYGKERESWKELFERTQDRFDLLGVTLNAWANTSGFSTLAREKAKADCKIRILLMHQDNKLLTGLLYYNQNLDAILPKIKQNFQFYKDLAAKDPTGKIEVRQIRKGIPHFFVTISDDYAVMIQYQSFQEWGSGPTWKIPNQSKLYDSVVKEFDYLWDNGTAES